MTNLLFLQLPARSCILRKFVLEVVGKIKPPLSGFGVTTKDEGLSEHNRLMLNFGLFYLFLQTALIFAWGPQFIKRTLSKVLSSNLRQVAATHPSHVARVTGVKDT